MSWVWQSLSSSVIALLNIRESTLKRKLSSVKTIWIHCVLSLVTHQRTHSGEHHYEYSECWKALLPSLPEHASTFPPLLVYSSVFSLPLLLLPLVLAPSPFLFPRSFSSSLQSWRQPDSFLSNLIMQCIGPPRNSFCFSVRETVILFQGSWWWRSAMRDQTWMWISSLPLSFFLIF